MFILCNVNYSGSGGGRNRLKLENEEGGGAYQLTLQLTVYRTIHISSPSPSTIKIIKTTK